jgi:nitrite reductase (NADH) large subunit
VVVDDADGEAARLDAEIEATVAAYRDPWQEGVAPSEPTQFIDSYSAATAGESCAS